MKFTLVLLFVLAAKVSANPRKYHYVSSEQFEDRISDFNMHPDLPTRENKYAAKLNSKALDDELKSEYWLNNAKAFVEEQLKRTPNTKKAKNIIMFLGDGMSHPTITSARIYMGGEEKKLSFEDFPYTASSKTYCVDKQVSDSACTATAYLHGVKANDATIGLSARATRSNCADSNDSGKRTSSIAAWAIDEGKDAGFVTTTRATHASPSGVYAHTTDRDWENDQAVTQDNCDSNVVDDIAEQLIYNDLSKKLKVMMAGGSKNFIDSTEFMHDSYGNRSDGKNLINEWKQLHPDGTFVDNKQDMMSVDPSKVEQLFALFNNDHIPYNLDIKRDNLGNIMPSLTDMTLKAIDILSENENGYFLFVEGGRIDHGHHKNEAKYAVDETVEFSKAIEAALEKIDLEETLVVVTADHGHVMTIAGYADRGNDIFGIAGTGQDNIPYMTLSYANGLGYYVHTNSTGRVSPNDIDRSANGFRFPATVPKDSESHGGEDVGIWAIGPWAHLFQGTVEQNVIPHVMAYASCIGDGMKMCDDLD